MFNVVRAGGDGSPLQCLLVPSMSCSVSIPEGGHSTNQSQWRDRGQESCGQCNQKGADVIVYRVETLGVWYPSPIGSRYIPSDRRSIPNFKIEKEEARQGIQ